MKTLTKLLASLTLLMLLVTSVDASKAKKVVLDKETGLIVATGMDDVKANCTVCHSAKFITLQRGDRQTWKDMIVWMQKTQGLWEFDPKTEKSILDYLAKNYAPEDKVQRRKNLASTALPANPYDTKNK